MPPGSRSRPGRLRHFHHRGPAGPVHREHGGQRDAGGPADFGFEFLVAGGDGGGCRAVAAVGNGDRDDVQSGPGAEQPGPEAVADLGGGEGALELVAGNEDGHLPAPIHSRAAAAVHAWFRLPSGSPVKGS